MDTKDLVTRGILILDKEFKITFTVLDSEMAEHKGPLSDFIAKKETELISSYSKMSDKLFILDSEDSIVRDPVNRKTNITRVLSMYVYTRAANFLMDKAFTQYELVLLATKNSMNPDPLLMDLGQIDENVKAYRKYHENLEFVDKGDVEYHVSDKNI